MAFSYALDPTIPAGGEAASLGDDRIREFKNAMIERLESFFSDADNDPLQVKTGATFLGTATFGGLLTVTTGGLTVSAGTTAVQALTATTGVFSSTLNSSGLTTLASTNGGVIVGAVALAAQSQVILRAAAGQSRTYVIATGSASRWSIEGNNTAETGSDAGTNFFLRAFTDAGALIDSPMSIVRAAGGAITFARPVSMTSTLAVAATLSHTSAAANLVQNTGSSGTVTIGATDSTGTVVSVRVAAGARGQYALYTGSSIRWSTYKSESAESGGNAGSSYVIAAYDDTGVNIDLPMVIARAAGGLMTLSRPVSMSSTLAVTGLISGGISIQTSAAGAFYWLGRSEVYSPGDGIVLLQNAANTGFTRLQFGGESNAFPAWARSGAELHAVLADASGFTPVVASGFIQNGTPATSGVVRLVNNTSVAWRNAANTANHSLTLSATDVFGLSTNLAVTGQVTGTLLNATTALVGPGTAASSGSVRLANNTEVAWRNAADSANHTLKLDGSNVFQLTNGLTVANTLTVTTGGLTVSAGTTAVQALTATTGVFSGNVTVNGILSATNTLTVTNSVTAGTLISTGGVQGVTGTFSSLLQVTRTTQQLSLRFDASNHLAVTVASNGAVSYNATGVGAAHQFEEAVTIVTGGLNVTAGGILVLSGNISGQGLITTSKTAEAISAIGATTSHRYLRVGNTGNDVFLSVESSTGGGVVGTSSAYAAVLASNTEELEIFVAGTKDATFASGALTVHVATTFEDDVVVGGAGDQISFFGATLAGKGTVTGSRGGNAALQSLLTLLDQYGLLTDSST